MTEPLTITTEARDDHQLDMTIQIGPERTEELLRRAAKIVSRKYTIPGFRPGKAPYAAVLRRFGRERLLGEIIEEIGEEVIREALESNQVTPYGQISLSEVKLDPPTFKVVVPLPPTVELGDYRSIRLEAPEVVVKEEEVDQWLERVRNERTTWQTVARPAEVGDVVVMDIRGTVGAEVVMDNRDWQLLLKEESGWLPGFDNAFVGLSAGDEKTFTLTYPENSSSRYRGQAVTFQAKVKEVRAKVRPELNDEFARSLGDFQDMADLRAKMLARLTQLRTAEAEERLNNEAIKALLEKATITYPPPAVDRVLDEMIEDVKSEAEERGYRLEEYLRLQGLTVEQYRAQLRPRAEQRLRIGLALGELARIEQISVSEEENQAELERIVNSATDREEGKRTRELLDTKEGRRFITEDLLTKKTLARLREIVTGRAGEVTPTAAEVSEQPPAAPS